MEKEKPKCPACGKEITRLLYTEFGAKKWDGEKWVEDEHGGDAEWYCPLCDYKLDYEELERLGVF